MVLRISDYLYAFAGWNLVSSLGSIVVVDWLFLYIIYLQLTECEPAGRYPWLTPQFYIDSLQALLNRSYPSLELGLTSPLKPHAAFLSLPLLSSVTNLSLSYHRMQLTPRCKQSRQIHTSQGEESFTIQLPNGVKRILSRDFIEWFTGFTDAEGAFLIGCDKKLYYTFNFSITLHIDDVNVLNYIHETLGIGSIFVYPKINHAIFKVRAQEEINIIIDILTLYPLNTTKQLNFLAFATAFKLYKDATTKKDVGYAVENIRDSINSKRINFEMPDSFELRITDYWFLGLTEGDGSFFIERRNYQLGYSIAQKGNKLLMEALVNYLNNLGTHKGVKGFCNLYSDGGVWKLRICREDALHLVIIPLFDSVIWRSKKLEDYQDWKAILFIKQKFLHNTPKGKDLIEKLLAQMNNNRLSTSGIPRVNRALMRTKVASLLKEPANAELRDGKIWIKSEKRFLKKPSDYQKAFLKGDFDLHV